MGKFIKALKIPCLPNNKHRSNATYSNLSPADVESILETKTAEARVDLRILLDAAARSKLPNELIIKSELVGECFLLLHHSPCLQTLRVTMREDLRTIALSALGDFAGGVPAGLQSMSELSIFYDYFQVSHSLVWITETLKCSVYLCCRADLARRMLHPS